ncbi:hypothetical protein [Pararcticibacter amylolyticus]|uniref:Uncharacterized protein n=1 Tax=Pararcticibacter amylolyticus TaxID=2173175 RepID=A0A2U2PK00_9SPHI|nr:hypothetical protein [Pararcticibacter amylolyticus]PWG81594.1 hypothetical protein DDR33_07115 [Pararcticibacter amylolyticus]
MAEQLNLAFTDDDPRKLSALGLKMAQAGLTAFGPGGIATVSAAAPFLALHNSGQAEKIQSMLLQDTISKCGDIKMQRLPLDVITKVDSYMTTYYNVYLPVFKRFVYSTPANLYQTPDPVFNKYWKEFELDVTQRLGKTIDNLLKSGCETADGNQTGFQFFIVAANKHLLLYQMYAAYANQSYKTATSQEQTYNMQVMTGLLNTYDSYITHAITTVSAIHENVRKRLALITPVSYGGRLVASITSLGKRLYSLLGGFRGGMIGHNPLDEGYLFQDNGAPLVTRGYGNHAVDPAESIHTYFSSPDHPIANVVYFSRVGLFDSKKAEEERANKDRDIYIRLATKSIKNFYHFPDDIKADTVAVIRQWVKTTNDH